MVARGGITRRGAWCRSSSFSAMSLVSSAVAFAGVRVALPSRVRARARSAPSARGIVVSRVSPGAPAPFARPRAVAPARGAALRVAAAGEEDLERELGVPPPESAAATAAAAAASASDADQVLDTAAVGRYLGATACQALVMIWLTTALGLGLERSGLDLAYQKAIVGAWFLFNALKSRTFSPLDASRPKVANEKTAIVERKRPAWMPPPLAFPIIWSTIALLRAASSVAVFVHVGGLDVPAIHAMLLHLAVGDTWNSINNVERRLGVAVVGVGCVLLSVYNVVLQYWKVTPNAGYLIAPSAVWISVATVLVWTIWRINPRPDGSREPLFPTRPKAAAEVA